MVNVITEKQQIYCSCIQSVSESGNFKINYNFGGGEQEGLLGRGGFGQEDELDCLEEILGWNRGSKSAEKVWIPEQSSVAGACCLSRLVMESERWVTGSATRSGKLCGLDPVGTGEPDVALWRAKVVVLRALLQNFGWRE